MNISEVEKATGISKKTIRFYEEQELLNPKRAENGYRIYGEKELRALNEIKFLRSLSIPIDTIRKIRDGRINLSDAVKLQLDNISREQENLEKIKEIGKAIIEENLTLEQVDMEGIEKKLKEIGDTRLSAMEEYNHHQMKVSNMAGILFILIFIIVGGVLIWAAKENYMPIWVMLLCMVFVVWPIAGTIAAMVQRKRELKRGEIYDATKY